MAIAEAPRRQTEASRAPLSLERYFTRDGVHPYEEVQWELRDAVIPGEKGPVFEQKGVEVPAFWSQTATNVVASKYFRGILGTPEREWSVKQLIDRVAKTIAGWGREGGYFATDQDAQIFEEELAWLVLHQHMSFNSPVWFNIGVAGSSNQASACFILSVEDDMESILDWFKTEGRIFKGGSGSGVNVSTLRSSKEHLSGGGYASGPVSFMRGADSVAGSIKSGGTTRRAAKMVILNADHPDVKEFIWCKAKEEEKAWALGEAGYDMSLNGEAWASIQFQNANNSVRATDEFMRAAAEDRDWTLKAVKDGSVMETLKARALLREISDAAWRCGDPGMQFDTTINDWHTLTNTGRINGSNPCFPADARVHTTLGLLPIGELYERAARGEELRVYTHRATGHHGGHGVIQSTPVAVMRNGVSPIVRLRFRNGAELRCTPNHRIWTMDRGYVAAEALTRDDRVMLNDAATPASDAAWDLPVKVEALAVSRRRGGETVRQELPWTWTPWLAELAGHLVGDGCMTEESTTWVYGGDDLTNGLSLWHEDAISYSFGGASRSEQPNGTLQLRVGSSAVRELLRGIGVSTEKAAHKRVPAAIFTAPSEVQAAFLRGLYGADGCVSRVEGKASRYVGLGSASEALLKDVLRLLAGFGIRGRIYPTRRAAAPSFSYTRKDGTRVEYDSQDFFDLRITGSDLERFAESINFSSPRKAEELDAVLAECARYRTRPYTTLVSREDDGQAVVYNLTEPLHHSYIVDGFLVANCSEYMSSDDSACNLASLNLMRFIADDGEFDPSRFARAVDLTITAQEILVGNSSYPTPKIERNAKAQRQLGLGYANLGAVLMQRGLPYDSEGGRAYAAAITALMTGEAYAQSARIAANPAVGPFEDYAKNREPMLRVIGKHRDAAYLIPDEAAPPELLAAARGAWDDALTLGGVYGFRNAQASVLAPTGCLVGDSLVTTSRGLVRLRTLGDTEGRQWQDLDVTVATDEGPRQATQFYVNGMEAVVSVETSRGYRIQGTPTHRLKVVDPDGNWVWRRLGEIKAGDRVPLMLNGLVGEPHAVALPPIGELYWTADHRTRVPRTVTPELAEFVGYFMGDGSLHPKGLRLTVTAGDADVIAHLRTLGEELFGLESTAEETEGDVDVVFNSVPLAVWWQASGFTKHRPTPDHRGKGWLPHVPDAILQTNDRAVYAAFVRGLFEADGTVSSGYASFTTTHLPFSRDVQSLLLALGYVTTRKVDPPDGNWGHNDRHVLRLLNVAAATRFLNDVGFISARKRAALLTGDHRQASRDDHIPVSRTLLDRLVPENDTLRKTMLMSLARRQDVSRRSALALLERGADVELEQLLGFYYDEVATVELKEDEPTFDLSVPENVTYVANGFVSHNTISFMMDCDTTGVEPDIALVKYKKLVGGGTLKLVNQTVPAALGRLGYTQSEVEAITAFIAAQGTIEGAPALKDGHLAIFDCAFKPQNGARSISHLGHIKMMGAVQPFISGAISKTVNLPENASVEDVMDAYVESWKHGVKAIAVYRDGSKKTQPLSTTDANANEKKKSVETVYVEVAKPQRRRLPDTRASLTHKFSIEGHECYITVGLFEDGRPGELFITIAKEGSTLSGMLDAFARSVSLLLQYGAPLSHLVEKFAHMRFEPSGWTGNPEIGMAKSIVDYVFRWLGLRFLSDEEKAYLGLVRETGVVADAGAQQALLDRVTTLIPERQKSNGHSDGHPAADLVEGTRRYNSTPDAPPCSNCGYLMIRNGTCHKCENCGSTSGCS